ncbi:hypothetical protein [Mastigocoleus testarum]|uniref:Uncharacterized protein n=1 Tax=Mastigocoleus testarum BC008 TaxID=371196 RepID=A0A0V7ZPR3_9CYAN|nr:hypothetical protein [Mastigocoleus testarum]KST66557.1 hypothetical protein BC008_43320 [Mastigocoleus testarum BC008]
MTNKLFAITAVSLLSLASLSLSIMPSEANTTTAQLKNKRFNLTKKCRAAITTATNRLEKNPSLKVVQSPTDRVPYDYYPQGRPHRQSFYLQGAGVKPIMNSSVLMASIAKPVINNCNSVSLVSFGTFGTDWIEDFGLMSNGKVQQFNCPSGFAPPFYPRPLRWGESCNP